MKELLNKGAILILSGPSGCGKSSLLKELYKKIDNYYFSISTTTRKPRVGEQDGVEYNFVTKEEFEKDIDEGHFLEYARVHKNYYGTSLKPIEKALKEGKLVIFDIDVQGHDLVRQELDEVTTSVFITTPTLSELEKRLNNRATDSKEIIKNRIKNAKREIKSIKHYDYFICNDNFEEAVEQLICIAKMALNKTTIFDSKQIKKYWLNN